MSSWVRCRATAGPLDHSFSHGTVLQVYVINDSPEAAAVQLTVNVVSLAAAAGACVGGASRGVSGGSGLTANASAGARNLPDFSSTLGSSACVGEAPRLATVGALAA